MLINREMRQQSPAEGLLLHNYMQRSRCIAALNTDDDRTADVETDKHIVGSL